MLRSMSIALGSAALIALNAAPAHAQARTQETLPWASKNAAAKEAQSAGQSTQKPAQSAAAQAQTPKPAARRVTTAAAAPLPDRNPHATRAPAQASAGDTGPLRRMWQRLGSGSGAGGERVADPKGQGGVFDATDDP